MHWIKANPVISTGNDPWGDAVCPTATDFSLYCLAFEMSHYVGLFVDIY
jgi:hypothetical protein